MSSINCPRCGAPLDSRSTFCGNCGYSQQADGKATYRPSQAGELPYPNDRTSSSAPTYRANNVPNPPNGADTASSSPTYPAGGLLPPPPPFYPNSNTPSSVNYPGSNANYPQIVPSASGTNFPPTPPAPRQPRRRGNGGIIAISIIALIVILAGGGLYVFRSALLPQTKTGSTSTTTATSQPATSTVPTVTATTSTDVTPTDTTSTTPTGTTGTTPTVVPTTSTSSTSYTAIQPGPGCDTNGGTWTPQAITSITCGTQLSVKGNTRGYLYLQLPNNKAFSANNIIGVSSSVNNAGYCVGLVEQGTNTGYLAEYCGDGNWAVYSISNGGAIVQTLAKSLTSTRANEQLSLTMKGAMLSFSIDTEVHNVSVTAIQPTKVAIAYASDYYDSTATVTNFSYTAV